MLNDDFVEAEGSAVSAVQMIPDTRGGRVYWWLLMIFGVSSIVGMADQLRAIFWRALAGPSFSGLAVPQRLLMLAGWAIMCWCAVRAYRKNALPPSWAVVSLPLLIGAYLLWPALSS